VPAYCIVIVPCVVLALLCVRALHGIGRQVVEHRYTNARPHAHHGVRRYNRSKRMGERANPENLGSVCGEGSLSYTPAGKTSEPS
jgi:hypothetical protein